MSQPNQNLQPFVDRLSSHSQLSDQESRALLELPTRASQARPNQDMVRLGEKTDHACFIVDGLAGRFGQNRNGARQITALHIPGDMADLHSVVLSNATSAFQALTTTTFLTIPHKALRDVAARSPAVAEAFWRECMIDAAILSQWVVNVGRRDSKTRIAHLLCEMALRYGAKAESRGSYAFPATQTHIADMTALTNVHVNRTLGVLRDAGLAQMHLQQVEILDWKQLQAVAEFDPDYLGTKGSALEPLRLLDRAAPLHPPSVH